MNEASENRCDSTIFVIVLKILIVTMFIYPLAHYALIKNDGNNSTEAQNTTETETITDQTTEPTLLSSEPEIKPVKKMIIKQPSCPLSYLEVILYEICRDLYMKKEMCTNDDIHNLEKHKIPKIIAKNNSTTSEPRGTIVGYLASGLLLTSLGAAIVELYKAKSQINSTSTKTKPSMSRKCSLADLTVLKHNRKELVRRESILEIPDGSSSSGAGPLKQLGLRSPPPPLYRRCSFPVGPNEFNYGFNNYAADSRRMSRDSQRFPLIEEGRRSSIDCRNVDARRISVDDSPERRHWSRLVHRH